MALSLSGSLILRLAVLLSNPNSQSTPQDKYVKKRLTDLATGAGANQADRLFYETRTIAASGTFDYDLAGSLVDVFGTVITFVRIKFIFIETLAANTNNVVIGNAASNQFVGPFGAATHTLSVRPGAAAVPIWAPDATAYPVTAGTGDLLRLTNSAAGTGVTFDIAILGASS